MGMPREKGSPPSGAASSPYKATYTALSLRPADSRTSRRRTPVHSAQPTAPRIHCVPPTCGSNRLRPLPAHSRTICMVTCGRQYRSSKVWESSRWTSPSTRSAHPRRSLLRARSGMPPLLRTKWRAVGVTASSSRWTGSSPLNGSSEWTIMSGLGSPPSRLFSHPLGRSPRPNRPRSAAMGPAPNRPRANAAPLPTVTRNRRRVSEANLTRRVTRSNSSSSARPAPLAARMPR